MNLDIVIQFKNQ